MPSIINAILFSGGLMRIRTSIISLLVATIIALAVPITAEALPSGVYFVKCVGGRAALIDGYGYTLATGWCTGGDWTHMLIVQPRSQSPVAPTLDPPGDDVWQGASASDWVAYIGQFTPFEGDEYTDPSELQGEFPTLTANEAHFDPEE
jgi:hypothetical protein